MINIDEIAVSVGLRPTNIHRLPKIWISEGCDVKPFFCPDIKNRFGGILVRGGFGIYIPDFENEWISINKKLLNKRWMDSFTLALYIANINSFDNPPLFSKGYESSDNGVTVEEWLFRISSYLARFPKSLKELDNSFRDGFLNGVEIQKYFGHWVKIRYLSSWSKKKWT